MTVLNSKIAVPAAPATVVGGRRRKPSGTQADRHRAAAKGQIGTSEAATQADVLAMRTALEALINREAAPQTVNGDHLGDTYDDMAAYAKSLQLQPTHCRMGSPKISMAATRGIQQPRQGF